MKTNTYFPQAGELIYTQAIFSSETTVKQAVQYFKNHSGECMAVIQNDGGYGLVSRHHLFTRATGHDAWSLYSNESISFITHQGAMQVSHFTSGLEVLRQILKQPPESVQDDVIVTKNGNYHGLIAVKALMQKGLEYLGIVSDGEFLKPKLPVKLLKNSDSSREPLSRSCLEGNLTSVSVVDLLKLLMRYGETGCLNLRANSDEQSQCFKVFLICGRLVHAAGAGDSGHEALWKALRFRHGRFCFCHDEAPDVLTMDGSLQESVLERISRQSVVVALVVEGSPVADVSQNAIVTEL